MQKCAERCLRGLLGGGPIALCASSFLHLQRGIPRQFFGKGGSRRSVIALLLCSYDVRNYWMSFGIIFGHFDNDLCMIRSEARGN